MAPTKNLLLLLLGIFFALCIAEGALRVLGYKPGMYIHNRWFTAVDKLTMRKGIYADSFGIMRVSNEAALTITNKINSDKKHAIADTEVNEVYNLVNEVFERNHNTEPSVLDQYVAKLQNQALLTDLDSAVIAYGTNTPVNSDGFKSVAFKHYNTKKKKVLLLGDSFTWGHSAKPVSNGFADILLGKGYIVYNTAISGTDPAQYLAVAKQYIAALKPDYVIANFFIGNDVLYVLDKDSIRYFNRPVLPYTPVYFSTNAGNLLACPQGTYYNNAIEAYRHSYSYFYIAPTSAINRFCSYTVCCTLIWKVLYKAGLVSTTHIDTWQKTEKLIQPLPACNAEMKAIDSLCNNSNCKFLLVTINDVHNPGYGSVNDFPYLFEGMQYYESPVKKDGYNMIDDHYNNIGHRQYADFLHRLIESQH